MKHYYTIGEVSNLLGIKPHVIRYWESEFSFLKPRREEGRIRKYSSEKIELLRRIQDLLHNQRFTIEGARQKIKSERSAARYKEKLDAITPPPAPKPADTPQIKGQIQELKSSLKEIINTCERIKKED